MRLPPSKPHPTLDELLAKAKARGPLTPGEIWDQRISFAYGNGALSNDRITREMVEALAIEIYGPRPVD